MRSMTIKACLYSTIIKSRDEIKQQSRVLDLYRSQITKQTTKTPLDATVPTKRTPTHPKKSRYHIPKSVNAMQITYAMVR